MLAVTDAQGAYDRLYNVYLPVAIVVFVLVALALVVVALRFRSERHPEPSTRNSSARLELAYTVMLGVIAAVLLWRSYDALSTVGAPTESSSAEQAAASPVPARASHLQVGVVASRWNWRFSYPGGVVQTGAGLTHPAVLVVPAGTDVDFRMTSRDVVHALWIPALRAKYDATPGYTNAFTLRFAPGRDYSTARCSEFCGEYHDLMTFGIRVLPRGQFDAWLSRRRAAGAAG